MTLCRPLQAGKNWMFSNAKSPQHCELMAGHLRNRVTASGAPFQLRLHLIYLINDVLHHWSVAGRVSGGGGRPPQSLSDNVASALLAAVRGSNRETC